MTEFEVRREVFISVSDILSKKARNSNPLDRRLVFGLFILRQKNRCR